MDPGDPKPDFSGVVDSVMYLFGEVMSREAVSAVVEHYGGDLDQSIDAIMVMSDDQTPASQLTPSSQSSQSASTMNQHVEQIRSSHNMAAPTSSPVSYAAASQSNRTGSKHHPNPRAPRPNHTNTNKQYIKWTPQTEQIVGYHAAGSRTLILLRGLPGSGKSYLAKQLLLAMCPEALFETHIFSTDDYFFDKNGKYNYDRNNLSEAHTWNQNRAIKAMREGLSPIFIDNTNVEIWEMVPYVQEGMNNGYIIEVLEPNTPWAKKPYMLANKNSHHVPIGTIRRMLDNYQNGVSGVYIMRGYKLSYPENKIPPVLRDFPPILPRNPPTYPPQQEQSAPPPSIQANIVPAVTTSIAALTTTQLIDTSPAGPSNSENIVITESMTASNDDTENCAASSDSKHDTSVDELAKQFEDIEHAWDNSESWSDDEEKNASRVRQVKLPGAPQPPRQSKNIVSTDKLLPAIANNTDWSNISMFLPAWNDYQGQHSQASPSIRVETASKGTSVEFGDTDVNSKNLKILVSTPKDININHSGSNEDKVPEKRMLDKGTTTNDNDHIAAVISRCKHEEKHFATLKRLFKNVPKVELRDIFDKCVGDVNWAVDIVLDDMANRQLQAIDSDDSSDPEYFGDEECKCLAAYSVIPNINAQAVDNASNSLPEPEPIPGPSRLKKNKIISESTVQLKRQIEKKIGIAENHYSDHCLKLRKLRRGEENHTRADSPEEDSSPTLPAGPNNTTDTIADTASVETDEEASSSVSDEGERTVNVDLGTVFVNELDGMFGRDDMHYPENVETRVNMPVSLLNEINALWIESLMHQFDEQSRQSEVMLRQDEEFARQLALKEEELARAGQEPAIPDFKEIMDMELALSIYKREVTAEWRSNEPNDLAARMTREKLYNLFPEVQSEVLSELLMAHDNNFQDTVEVLLSSTGNAQVLEEPNGLTKFIAKKELERQEKILAEQKKALSDVEWPLLPKDSKIDMVTVQKYRAKATEHLNQRNIYYQKAQEFFNRDMTQVATYYSDVAVLHKKKYDQANSLAAASLMQFHASNCTDNATIDLHFLHVPEAKESLDLFIDTHIKKLRDSAGRPGLRFHNLFFITGRGLHSRGGPRIKPAVKRRLKERGIAFTERNPGLLGSKVCAEDKMTFELP